LNLLLNLYSIVMYDSPSKIFQYIPIPKKRRNTKIDKIHWQGIINDQRKHTNYATTDYVPNGNENITKSPETKGREQNAKDITFKVENDKHKLDMLLRKSNRSIISISSVFPWNFFSDTINVEESRVTFNFRQLFASQSQSVDIKDISNVFIQSGVFFSTLQVVSRTFTQNDIKINFLRKYEAIQTREVIEGLRTFAFHDIDTSNYEINELTRKLKELNVSKRE
jgi:hypothetical protein